MIKRIRFTAEAFEKYLDGLNDKFGATIIWDTLQGKSEYGTTKSEKGYQIIAADKAAIMAEKLGLNAERTAFYTKCLGAAFPPFGQEGKKLMREYAYVYDLPYDEKELMASVIEESFSQSGKLVVEGLRDILLVLFDRTKDSDIPEIELAKLYHEQMEILKLFDKVSREDYVEGEQLLDEEVNKNINTIGITECKKQLMAYNVGSQATANNLTTEEMEKYFGIIDQYKEYSGDECLINFMLHAKNLD